MSPVRSRVHRPFTSRAGRATRLAVFLALLGGCSPLAAQDNAADARRVVEHLLVKPGMTLAEIGAGSGELTVALARTVGAGGRVYSNEISESRRVAIRAAVSHASLTNVTVVEGAPADANLPDDCCDGIFMRNVYHHFADPGRMNQSLWRALKPGGRLLIIDFPPRRGREAPSSADRDKGGSHGVSAASVQRELREAGFEIVSSEDGPSGRWFMVVGRKP
ncbi:MAG: class I SAM-dependent methyltransferase [Vicinamibacterales bacterium]